MSEVKAKDLKIGDKIKITGPCQLPYVHKETQEIFKKLAERGIPVTIAGIDDGIPYYNCKFKNKGIMEYHSLSVFDEDKNWEFVE